MLLVGDNMNRWALFLAAAVTASFLVGCQSNSTTSQTSRPETKFTTTLASPIAARSSATLSEFPATYWTPATRPRPCRDMLFTVVSRDEKYKAKNLIDTFIYRGGDALSASAYAGLVAVLGAVASEPVIAGAAGIAVCLVWFALSIWLARRFNRTRSMPSAV